MCNRTKVLDGLVPCETNAIIFEGDRLRLLVERDANARLAVSSRMELFREFNKAHFVERVRCIGHELSQEDVAVGVDRVNHQVEKLLNFCFKPMLFDRWLFVAHRCLPCGAFEAAWVVTL